MAIYNVNYKHWELSAFGNNQEYDLLLQLHYNLVAKSIGYACDSYTMRFMKECKINLRTLQIGGVQLAAQASGAGLKASYAHHAVAVLRGLVVVAIFDPIKKAGIGQKNIETARDAEERYQSKVWLDDKLTHYERVVKISGSIATTAPRAVITYQRNYVVQNPHDLILVHP